MEWESVKALAKDKVLTIGSIEEVDESNLNEVEQKNLNIVSEAKAEFRMPDVKSIEKSAEKGSKKTLTLSDLVDKRE